MVLDFKSPFIFNLQDFHYFIRTFKLAVLINFTLNNVKLLRTTESSQAVRWCGRLFFRIMANPIFLMFYFVILFSKKCYPKEKKWVKYLYLKQLKNRFFLPNLKATWKLMCQSYNFIYFSIPKLQAFHNTKKILIPLFCNEQFYSSIEL